MYISGSFKLYDSPLINVLTKDQKYSLQSFKLKFSFSDFVKLPTSNYFYIGTVFG